MGVWNSVRTARSLTERQSPKSSRIPVSARRSVKVRRHSVRPKNARGVRLRRLALLGIALIALSAAPASATGGDGGATVGQAVSPRCGSLRRARIRRGTRVGRGRSRVICSRCPAAKGQARSGWGVGTEPNPPVEGTPYWLVCSDGFVTIITYQAANIIDPATLARRAFAELPLIYPRPRTAPPITSKQLVGVRSWMWVDPADWQPMSATATIVGLSATVTAQPSMTIWNMGDGTTVTCKRSPARRTTPRARTASSPLIAHTSTNTTAPTRCSQRSCGRCRGPRRTAKAARSQTCNGRRSSRSPSSNAKPSSPADVHFFIARAMGSQFGN